ncbi:hypothetical protein D9613_010567 [Agrocybe pediades]|uniref:Uncharacterized protein n=1 Tax=Agrocybe pediades TaxID=84607 RepID=A0A8H4QFX7_9AGAR|nr:hypothetical protein D9613_010567 [Agrocybe pediades]
MDFSSPASWAATLSPKRPGVNAREVHLDRSNPPVLNWDIEAISDGERSDAQGGTIPRDIWSEIPTKTGDRQGAANHKLAEYGIIALGNFLQNHISCRLIPWPWQYSMAEPTSSVVDGFVSPSGYLQSGLCHRLYKDLFISL